MITVDISIISLILTILCLILHLIISYMQFKRSNVRYFTIVAFVLMSIIPFVIKHSENESFPIASCCLKAYNAPSITEAKSELEKAISFLNEKGDAYVKQFCLINKEVEIAVLRNKLMYVHAMLSQQIDSKPTLLTSYNVYYSWKYYFENCGLIKLSADSAYYNCNNYHLIFYNNNVILMVVLMLLLMLNLICLIAIGSP